MIKFEIYSNDENIPPSPVSIYYPVFLIGNTSRCHLRLRSTDRQFPCIRCEIKESKVYFETTSDLAFLLNGKKVLGLVTVQVNDLIKLNTESFRIIEVVPNSDMSELNHEALYDNFYTHKEEFESVLGAIEKELIYSNDDLFAGNSPKEAGE